MSKPSDLLVVVLVVVAVTWFNVPKLILPGLVVTMGGLSIYRWRRQSQDPAAAERYRWQLVASTIVLAGISVPMILGLVPPNGVYGFRTAVTRSSPDVWYAANTFLGWGMLLAAAGAAAALVWLPRTANRGVLLAAFLVPIFGAVLASFIYLDRLS